MKVIVAGSRSITDYELVKECIEKSDFEITEVVCGMAQGVDLLGKQYAEENNIAVKEFPANWKTDGRKIAGHLRNEKMAKYADGLILIWDGTSTGSNDMLKRAIKHDILIDVYDMSQPRLF